MPLSNILRVSRHITFVGMATANLLASDEFLDFTGSVLFKSFLFTI
ncbi:hypothetical protein T12_14401 [Trichinella patagoniensis]|uniref:Uncharacterized protein n=1 Tax=Trichinella patagoniensis TaxID=990121 RepID=A0A0V0YZ54_9BILA|nr:hypothetical protein T12_14401 [Trichinella patagoniensis]